MRVAHVDVRVGAGEVDGAAVVVSLDPVIEDRGPLDGPLQRVEVADHRLGRLGQRDEVLFESSLVVVHQRRELVGEQCDVRQRPDEGVPLVGDRAERLRKVRVQVGEIGASLRQG